MGDIKQHLTAEQIEKLIKSLDRSEDALLPVERASRLILMQLVKILQCCTTLIKGFGDALLVGSLEKTVEFWLGWQPNPVHRAWWLLARPALSVLQDSKRSWSYGDRIRSWAFHDGPDPPAFPLLYCVVSAICFLLPRVLASFFWDKFTCLRADIWALYLMLLLHPVWVPYWIPPTRVWFTRPIRSIWRCWFGIFVAERKRGYLASALMLISGELLGQLTSWQLGRVPLRFDVTTPPGKALQAIALCVGYTWAFYLRHEHRYLAPCLRIRNWVWSCLRKPVQRQSIRGGEEQDYAYEPLEPRFIRLLDLKRDAWTWQLNCRIRHVALDDNPAYEAISYTWGSMTASHNICVGGKWLSITSNANTILQDRASFFETRTIWIDCICIDQQNISEKNVQVPLMDEIYRRAKRTVMHLGEYPDAGLAFSLVRDLLPRHRLIDSTVGNPEFEAFVGWATDKQVVTEQQIRQEALGYLRGLAVHDPRWLCLAQIMRHDYFSRVWILQEVVFASKCHVRCGGSWLDWKDFSQAMALIVGDEFQGAGYLGKLCESGPVPTRFHILRLVELKDKEALFRLLEASALRPTLCEILAGPLTPGLKASDPRDRVYGLVNVSRDAKDPDFAPDYSATQDLGEFFTMLCRKFLRRGRARHIFRVAGIWRRRSIADLPSWVPDWTCQSQESVGLERPFRAGGEEKPRIELKGEGEITIGGIIIDEIAKVSSRQFPATLGDLRESPASDQVFHLCIAVLEALRLSGLVSGDRIFETSSQSPSRSEAVWKTMVGDAVPNLQRKSAPWPAELRVHSIFTTLGVTVTRLLHTNTRVRAGDHEIFLPACQRAVLFPPVLALLEAGHASADRLLELFDEGGTSLKDDLRTMLEAGAANLITGVCFRRFAVLKSGRMALVPPLTAVGDSICVGVGLESPLVLRRDSSRVGEHVFRLVGEAYFNGIMDGELAAEATENPEVIRVI
ncbi:heterokaryon incompatibility protein-domain-containing protein [Lasiosphaeria hispida]|uniref:Heterokaryon incompatibility protein-domain-containing protein n=1 Tax=Lasiosphaeria hispida TaxID=260671 RepID=A0AAJ0HTK9_9PEZI|nr:heterokaryon incompatibility protein-domain-containing protein [Lasiosphaeria hispida]